MFDPVGAKSASQAVRQNRFARVWRAADKYGWLQRILFQSLSPFSPAGHLVRKVSMFAMSEYGHTLVASVSGQPQIVTLTLDLLLRQEIPISEVVVLHPASTNERVLRALHCLHAEFAHRCYTCDAQTISCRLDLEGLSHDGETLTDITDTPGAHATRDAVHRLLRRLKLRQRHIHLSASGGRRIISLMAISAAQLHFDSFDRIWHIYTPPEVRAQVNEGALMHVPAEAGVRLIEVPFVPWGTIFSPLSQAAESARATQRVQRDMLDAQEKARCRSVVEQATRAQLGVLQQFSEGLTPARVAKQLGISTRTVYSHTSDLLLLVRNAWCIPAKEPLDYHFLSRKFARYFDRVG
jgi:CRISPR-associated protein Csx14